ncbi:hypothetical protein LVB87_02180 [Lysobacter sp. KIS68-7]|uniref:hypothetical protein n=1 Tax=Lysobacter sp. KIS68-7 TaxID=2904252 RepID=UPI001E297060|nr:hypothetical protein [Lysobacter sp. KIS68-7]UHQ19989.1 hypothetical protein LVB87_02180 [Lysobacter sp. KIS68-7]
MSDHRPAWDAFQRDVLDALGHVMYVAQAPRAPVEFDAPPLLRALAQAANARVAQLPALPPMERLRTPSAKRALWPQLRALRKGSRA